MVKEVESLKVQIEQAKFGNGEKLESVAEFSSGIEEQQAAVDMDIALLEKCLVKSKIQGQSNS